MIEGGGDFVCRFVGAEGRCLIRFPGLENDVASELRTLPLPPGKGGHPPRRVVRRRPWGCIARGGSVGELCGMQAARWEEGGATCPLRAGFSEGTCGRAAFFRRRAFLRRSMERWRNALSR